MLFHLLRGKVLLMGHLTAVTRLLVSIFVFCTHLNNLDLFLELFCHVLFGNDLSQ